VDYLEFHARSAFSFLRGASSPEELAAAAAAVGMETVALLDRDGVYGAPRFFQSTRDLGLNARVGAEITLADGSVLPLIAATRTGYENLCRLITTAKLTHAPLPFTPIAKPPNASVPASPPGMNSPAIIRD
jgi:error-prone DNA polymerase